MKEFDKFFDSMKEKYPLYQDKNGYNVGNIRALRVGWREALEWVLNHCSGQTEDLRDDILEELEEEE